MTISERNGNMAGIMSGNVQAGRLTELDVWYNEIQLAW